MSGMFFIMSEPICKPGSVVNDHLSGTPVAERLLPPQSAVEQTIALITVLLRIGFTLPAKLPAQR